MPTTFSQEWRNYKRVTKEIESVQAQMELFPGRKSSKQTLKELRRKLFKDYEGSINMNNQVNEFAAKTTIKNWFSTNCRVLSDTEVSNWVEKQDLKTNNIVRYIADDIIGQGLCQLCFKGGTPFCPQVKGDEISCASKLANEIVKVSDRYTHIPNTEKNFDVFMNSSTQYLEKEINSQDDNESPIEEIMFEALKPVAKRMGYRIQREYPMYDEGRLELRYSLDIVFIDGNTSYPVLDVETDGLTYHSGYQQMSNDRARDRWLLIRGIPTMRFTSREVFNDIESCVEQVESALKSLYNRGKKRR